MLATLTGAIAASGLGIAGTVIGAAFMSLASTVGAAIYKHYLRASHARLRAAAASLAPRASDIPVAAAIVRRVYDPEAADAAASGEAAARDGEAGADGQAGAGRQGAARNVAEAPDSAGASTAGRSMTAAESVVLNRPTAAPRPAVATADGTGDPAARFGDQPLVWVSPDVVETQLLPAIGGPDHAETVTIAAPLGARGPAHVTGVSGADGPSAGLPAGAAGADGPSAEPSDGVADTEPSAGARLWRSARQQWRAVAAVALGIFVMTMAAITVFEAVAGRPLDSVVWHRHGSGTTIGGLVGHHGPRKSHAPAPGHSASTSPSARPSGAPSSSGSASVTPSTGPSTSPTSSTTPAPGSSPSSGVKSPSSG